MGDGDGSAGENVNEASRSKGLVPEPNLTSAGDAGAVGAVAAAFDGGVQACAVGFNLNFDVGGDYIE